MFLFINTLLVKKFYFINKIFRRAVKFFFKKIMDFQYLYNLQHPQKKMKKLQAYDNYD
jgi:hypothetical protein